MPVSQEVNSEEKENMIKNALLINPPSGLYIREDRCQVPVNGLYGAVARPPLDLAYMASALREVGVICTIKDYPVMNRDWGDFKADLEQINPDMLVISVTTPTLDLDMKACNIAKDINPEILTVGKGAHFACCDTESLKEYSNLDVVIRGEYEYSIQRIGNGDNLDQILGITFRRNGDIIVNKDSPFIEDLDSIPFPDRDILDNKYYFRPDTGEMQTTIQTNRGCPSKCIFCLAQRVSGSKIRSRSPENIVNELEECVKKYNIRNFFFRADTFTWNKNWVIKICQEILDRGLDIKWVCNSRVDTIDAERLMWMKRAGCWLIAFGIESGNQEMLNLMKKGTTLDHARTAVRLCKEYRIQSLLYFVLGLPWETEKTAEDTINFAKELDGDYYMFHIGVPFPGTEFYNIALENNLITEDSVTENDYVQSKIRTFYLSNEDLQRIRRKALIKTYMRPRYFLNTYRKLRSPKMFINYAKFGFRIVRDLSIGNL